MDNKERLRKWLWLGLDETTAKKYQRKLSAENVRIIRNESVIIAGIGALYTICMLHAGVIACVCEKSGLYHRSSMDVLYFSLYAQSAEKTG